MSPLKSITFQQMWDFDDLVKAVHSEMDGKELLEVLLPMEADEHFYWERFQLIPYVNCLLLFDQVKPSNEEKHSFFNNNFFNEIYRLFPAIAENEDFISNKA